MTTRRQGRPKTTDATNQGGTTANGEKEQIENVSTSDEKPLETKEAKSEEKVIKSEENSELEKLKEENSKIKGELSDIKSKSDSKVIEVNTKTNIQEKRPIRTIRHNKMHDVFVKGKLRSMTKQSYEAVAKDPKLDVSLPKGSSLVEPNIQPCVDC